MARTVDAAFAPPDPARFLPGLPIRASDVRKLCRAVNKINADGGIPPIRMGWTDAQFAHSGVRTTYQRYPIPEWSSKHTAAGLLCRVHSKSFVGSTAKVRFTSANSGNWVEVAVGASAGWYDATTPLDCSFVLGEDEIEVALSTASGTLTIDAISCVWPEMPDPLDAGDNDGCLPFDDGETDADRPLSARLGEALIASLEAVEDRVQVYACFAGLDGIVAGGVDCSYMSPLHHWLWCLVWPGTAANNWLIQWRMHLDGAGSVLLVHGPEAAADVGVNSTDLNATSGSFRLIETAELSILSPLEVSDLDFLPGGNPVAGADPLVTSLAMWGR